MIIPINCPICNDPLVNTLNGTTALVIYKSCRRQPDHIFSCAVFMKGFLADIDGTDRDRVDRVTFTLSMSPLLSVEIYLGEKRMLIDKAAPDYYAQLTNTSRELPFYVEPDFSDYQKLISKIKTYLVLS